MSAVRAVVPTEQLPTALSQQQARQHVASLVGGPLGGALYAVTRWVPFLFDAVTFAVSWVLLGRIRTDLSPVAATPATPRRARADIAEGMRFIVGAAVLPHADGLGHVLQPGRQRAVHRRRRCG